MASRQTQYYGLNQWEAADQVLRTEFNADNQKIDGAPVLDKLRSDINALSARVDKLEEVREPPGANAPGGC